MKETERMKVKETVSRYKMIPKGSRVLVAVSGGADSMSLLNWLFENRGLYKAEIFAAHFNHGLRGEESDRDARFVRDFCEEKGIPLETGGADVASYARENGLGTEEAARNLRYGFLEKTAEKLGCGLIATAHNSDDNAETVLFNLARGSGMKGICGIPPVRGNIIRPLLGTTRAEIEEYLELKGIAHVEDSTNALDDYSRNLIRHKVMPVLKEINPGFSASVLRMGTLLRDDDAVLDAMAEELIRKSAECGSIPIKALKEAGKSIGCRAIRQMCPGSISMVHAEVLYELAMTGGTGYSDIPGLRVRKENGKLYF